MVKLLSFVIAVFRCSHNKTVLCLVVLKSILDISIQSTSTLMINKAGYTANPVACGWAGAVIEVTSSFGQEQ